MRDTTNVRRGRLGRGVREKERNHPHHHIQRGREGAEDQTTWHAGGQGRRIISPGPAEAPVRAGCLGYRRSGPFERGLPLLNEREHSLLEVLRAEQQHRLQQHVVAVALEVLGEAVTEEPLHGADREGRAEDAHEIALRDRVRAELVDRYGGPVPAPVEALFEVAKLRSLMAAAGIKEAATVARNLRIRPIELEDSRQVRLKRLIPEAQWKPATRTLLIPERCMPKDKALSWVKDIVEQLTSAA